MGIRDKVNWKKIVDFLGFIVFFIILFKVFCDTTYIFRDIGRNRNHVVGIENEKLDMVYIGASAAYLYWQPLRAWEDCGFTSYSYATNNIQAEQIQAYVEDALNSQKDPLFVIDVRAFEYYTDDQDEAGIRRGTDSMNMTSPVRYKLLNEYFKHRNITEDTDILSYYLDIIKYHTNTDNLGLSLAWEFRKNNAVSVNKGWEWMDKYAYLQEPADFMTDNRAELVDNSREILVDLLTYCQEEKLKVLFVVCPYWLTEEVQEKYNTIGDIVESYGFNYLNSNEYYDEMGLDFATDFYNRNHVNLFGAAKYTEFLEKYIVENYDMPDHRDDESYASWNEDYLRFIEEEELHAEAVTSLRLDVEKGLEIAAQMAQTETLSEWNNLAEDDRFTLFITADGKTEWPQALADQKVLTKWGFTQTERSGIRMIKNAEILYSDVKNKELSTEGTIGLWGDVKYCLSAENDAGSIIIDGNECSLNESGINIVVFDNNYQRVVDTVAMKCSEDGLKMVIER